MEESFFLALLALQEVRKRIFDLINELLKKEQIFDLRSDQVLALYYIGDRVIPIKALACSGVYNGSNPSYLIRSMIEKEYIVSRPCPNDMRVALISTSEKGKRCFEKMKVFFKSLEDQKGGL